MNKPTVVITHHALSQKHHTVRDVNNWHKERWPGFTSRSGYHVGYHFVIEWDGTVTNTRQFDEEGAHTLGMNKSSIGVCFMGNFDNHLPSPNQVKAWKKLYKTILTLYPDIPTKPHRYYASYKSCHGNLLNDTYFKDLVTPNREEMFSMIEKLKQIVSLLKTLRNKQQR